MIMAGISYISGYPVWDSRYTEILYVPDNTTMLQCNKYIYMHCLFQSVKEKNHLQEGQKNEVWILPLSTGSSPH